MTGASANRRCRAVTATVALVLLVVPVGVAVRQLYIADEQSVLGRAALGTAVAVDPAFAAGTSRPGKLALRGVTGRAQVHRDVVATHRAGLAEIARYPGRAGPLLHVPARDPGSGDLRGRRGLRQVNRHPRRQ